MQHLYRRIYANPEFHELERRRGRFAWMLALAVMAGYFAFVLVIAFAPGLFARPIAPGSTITLGIPVGVLVIVASFALTGVYVWRANTEFDRLVRDIVAVAEREGDV